MPITFRFYAELNDFLPIACRKQPFEQCLKPSQTIKHLIENLGVPHTEVEIILANGCSVGFDYQPVDGDRISVYPMFEGLDVTPLLKLRPAPLRDPRFLADAHLGKLARYLRLCGFDCLFSNDAGDRRLTEISLAEKRILLSRDRALLMRRELTHGCFVHEVNPEKQLAKLFDRLDLFRKMAPFTRCMVCNGRLLAIERHRVVPLVPKRVAELYTAFWRCDNCAKIYWQGSHYRQLEVFINRIAPPRE